MSGGTQAMGKVHLVGAGPGNPELITVKGLRLLRQADVVIYDRLVAPALLTEARADALLIDVGKIPYQKNVSQEHINGLLVEHARAGKQVVRLKGGDPFVFGRGGEEALACSAAGVPFEVVPGVSSAIAVPAYAGVPVTHRNVSTSFTVFTGHEDPDKGETTADYVALARAGTLVLMMGLSHLPAIMDRLLAAGLPPETPAVCVEWGTIERQRVVEATAGTIAARVIEAGLGAPATTIIGAVAGMPQVGLRWFHVAEAVSV